MRHHDRNKKLGREKNQRGALMKSLARSLVLHEKIKTTETKAKALRPYVERLITQSKKNTIPARRMVISKIGTDGAKKMFDILGPKYKERRGGYTRVTKLQRRNSDDSKMSLIELV